MLYWECKRRLETLLEFRKLVDAYFKNPLTKSPSGSNLLAVTDARNQINLLTREVLDSCELIDEPMAAMYHPPPMVGGPRIPLNLLRELFELRSYQISPHKVIDGIDRAIGEYTRRKKELYRKMFNPFFWIRLFMVKIIEVPFQILGAAGFNRDKIENSFAGKIAKLLAGFVYFVAAVLTVLQIIGRLNPVLKFLHITKPIP